MLPRFLVPDLDPRRSEATLPADEAHHLTKVLRLKVGDELSVFDGRGLEYRARVASVARRAVSVKLVHVVEAPRAPAVALVLVQAVLKGEAMDEVVRDATMVGVLAIQPVLSERVTVKASLVGRSADRWRRIALAAAKQCGRSTLPEIANPVPFATWVDAAPRGDAFLLAEPAVAGSATVSVRTLARGPIPRTASLIVGPEGGWTAAEIDLALAAGCTPLSLGRMTLRADAVPLAAAAALLAVWEEM
jgi:16S rRNA (uracil1498-N3)-methyltransferase